LQLRRVGYYQFSIRWHHVVQEHLDSDDNRRRGYISIGPQSGILSDQKRLAHLHTQRSICIATSDSNIKVLAVEHGHSEGTRGPAVRGVREASHVQGHRGVRGEGIRQSELELLVEALTAFQRGLLR
jgi:hypothetical protein